MGFSDVLTGCAWGCLLSRKMPARQAVTADWRGNEWFTSQRPAGIWTAASPHDAAPVCAAGPSCRCDVLDRGDPCYELATGVVRL